MLIRFLWLTWTEKPEVIFLDHVLLTPLAALGAILAPKARRYLFVYGDEVWKPASWARALLVGGLIQKVVAISQFTIARMRNSYGLSEDRFALLPCALDVGDGSSIRTTRDFKMTGLHRLLTVSRLDPREIDKGHSKVILALPSILAAFPDTHYYVVGEGPLQEKLRSLAEQTGVAAHVHFVGRVDDPGLEELYAGSHLFVMPSKKEGFGIVYLEAWRHGLPVIAGNKDASAEVIEHNVTGLLVDPDSEEEISRAIITLLSDGAARARMGQAGYATLAKKYSHAIFKERLDHILTQC